jgi:hypothetical protein
MRSKLFFALALAASLSFVAAGRAQNKDEYTVEAFSGPPPPEVAEAIRSELGQAAVRLKKGADTICEIWLRSAIPTETGGDTLGRSYPQIADMVLLGAMRVAAPMTDNRAQKFPTGVYVMRHGIQPQNGDHTGSTDFIDFAVLLNAKGDQTVKAPYANPQEMHKQSIADKQGEHPIVFALLPPKSASQPSLTKNAKEHWVLEAKAGSLVLAMVIVGTYEH